MNTRRISTLGRVSCKGFLVFSFLLVPASGAEVEPNDTLSTATSAPFQIGFDLIVSGLFVGNGDHGELDVDLFTIVVPSEWPLPIAFGALAVSDPPADLMLRLFDASGTELAANDDGNPFQPEIPALYTYFLAPGTYYLGVSSAENPLYDPTAPGSGRSGPGSHYFLSLGGSAVLNVPSSLEPNDTSVTATEKGNGSFTIENEWIGDNEYSRLDVDIYHLSLLGPSRIDVRVDSADGLFDPVVRVRSCADPLPTPTTMDRCNLGSSDDQPDGSAQASISTARYEAGDVYVMVLGSGNRGFDPAVAGSGQPGSLGAYSLYVDVTPLDAPDLIEPNDSTSTASLTPSLGIPGRPDEFSITGYIGNGPYATLRGDRDFYKLSVVDSSQVVKVDVETAGMDSSLMPILIAYDWQGRVLAQADGSATGEAQLILPAGCTRDIDFGAQDNLILMVMGSRQRPPRDPFDPIVGVYAQAVAQAQVEDGPGSTGTYALTVTTLPTQTNCSPEPNWGFDTATPAPIENGFYFCAGAFLGDSNCPEYDDLDLDAWVVELDAPAAVRVEVWGCSSTDPIWDVDLGILDSTGASKAEIHVQDAPYHPAVLSTVINSPGRYYVVVSSYCAFSLEESFNQECPPCGGPAYYDLAISLLPPRSFEKSVAENISPVEVAQPVDVFATSLENPPTIVRLDPVSGAIADALALPEPHAGGLGGLAVSAENLFYVGEGRFPILYRLEPTTGLVLDQYFLWFGSGYFTGAVMVNNELYLLDHRNREVQVMDPYTAAFLRTIKLGAMPDFALGGGLAALAGPNRLYVADALGSNRIYELYPSTGALTAVLEPTKNRPTGLAGWNGQLLVADFRTLLLEVVSRVGETIEISLLDAPLGVMGAFVQSNPLDDFDGDGDVDLMDVSRYQACFSAGITEPACERGDANSDGVIDSRDSGPLQAAITGP